MQPFKIDIFQRKFPVRELVFQPLVKSDCPMVVDTLISLFAPQKPETGQSLFQFFEQKAPRHFGFDASNPPPSSLFESPPSHSYLIWDDDEIDLFEWPVLLESWESIWFPPSDEAVIIFDREKKRAAMICDWGVVYSVV